MEIKLTGLIEIFTLAYGGTLANPINTLSEIISSLIDEKGKIVIPGFYEDVVEIEKSKRDIIEQKSKFNDQKFKDSLGLTEVKGEEGYSTLERKSIRQHLMLMEFGEDILVRDLKQLYLVKLMQRFQ